MKSLGRKLLVVFGVFAGAWLLLCAGFYWAMTQPPEAFGPIVARTPMPAMMVLPFETMWTRARAGSLRTGDVAPDFQLPTLDHRDTVRLSSFRGVRPVALVFGKLYLTAFRREVPALNKLFDEYKDRVAFYAVYIQEAHPSDIWQMRSNVRDGVVFASPRDEGERFNVAGSCVRNLGIRFPALIDGMDNAVERAYTGWPDRLVLIGVDGRVIYKSKPGPFGFRPADLAEALQRTVTHN